MAIISDNAIDHEIQKMKTFMEQLKQTQNVFSHTFPNMKPKERAKTITRIQADQRAVAAFLERAKKTDHMNSGTRFTLENLKQSYMTLMNLWRKTEKALDNFMGAASAKTAEAQLSEPDKAVQGYVEALKNMGHSPNEAMVAEFRERLQSAYTQAKEKAGRDLSIQIVQEGSKIKVRMEPK